MTENKIVFAGKKMSGEEFARCTERFNPDKFSADAWADHALEAGMRYAILTTRHHDGSACGTARCLILPR